MAELSDRPDVGVKFHNNSHPLRGWLGSLLLLCVLVAVELYASNFIILYDEVVGWLVVARHQFLTFQVFAVFGYSYHIACFFDFLEAFFLDFFDVSGVATA